MIFNKKELNLEKLFSKKIKVYKEEIEEYIKELKDFSQKNSIWVKRLITVTFGIETDVNGKQVFDLEIIIEPNSNETIYSFAEGFEKKEKLYITNALYTHYEGNNQGSFQAFNEINNYLISNKLQAITPAYSVSNNPFNQPDGNIDLEIYIGINPNIL